MGSVPFKEKSGDNIWTITMAIPFGVFYLHKPGNIGNKSLKANFYKCGDKLSIRHYLSWNKIETGKPDFHQPGYFGLLNFA